MRDESGRRGPAGASPPPERDSGAATRRERWARLRRYLYLVDGGVFTPDLIETWLDYERSNELDPSGSARTRTSSSCTSTFNEVSAAEPRLR
jgi:hypothetical protein